ncbi:MAG: transporter substrate-binding domain-containing protein [Rubrivivax sp.]|nr:transporter substrate-binding domain-containing protein [Rubrivivax sp.]
MHAFITRRRLLSWAGASASIGGSTACSTAPAVPAPVAAAFAPTGRLRACINLGNPILARRDAASGEVSGVSVDLARALAEKLGLALDLVVVDAAAKSVVTVKGGQADIGFFAIDPLRSDGIAFSAPYVQIEGAYLVRQDSALTDNAQVDRPGTRVMVGQGSAYDLFLVRQLKAAQLVRAPTSPTVVERMLAENADVAAGVKQQLQADAARRGGLRLLPGRFMVIEQAMGLQAGRGAAAEQLLRAFVEQAKASGFVAQALVRHGIQGAIVAPAAPLS